MNRFHTFSRVIFTSSSLVMILNTFSLEKAEAKVFVDTSQVICETPKESPKRGDKEERVMLPKQILIEKPIIFAQTPPASTYTPGDWQPINRVDNPDAPIRVSIINQTGVMLEYGITSGEVNSTIAPGASQQIPSIPRDANIVINTALGTGILDYTVSTTDNLVTITVRPGAGVEGDNAVNIHPSGAIYIY